MLTSEDLKQLSSLLDEKFEKNNEILRAEIVQSAESVKSELRAEITQLAESIRDEIVQSNVELREATAMSISQLRKYVNQLQDDVSQLHKNVSQLRNDVSQHHRRLKNRLLCGYAYQIYMLASA